VRRSPEARLSIPCFGDGFSVLAAIEAFITDLKATITISGRGHQNGGLAAVL